MTKRPLPPKRTPPPSAGKDVQGSNGHAPGTGSKAPGTRSHAPKPDHPDVLPDELPPEFPRNDDERAERFARHFKDDLRYVPAWKQWMSWNGARWVAGDEFRRASEMLKVLQAEAVTEQQQKQSVAWGNEHPLKAMVNLARHRQWVVREPSQFDANPLLLGLSTGTVELGTGRFREGRQDDYISKCAGATYDPEARCPLWENFLSEIFKGDAALIDFVQRAVGYCLTGLTNEQVLFFAYGGGSNGKSTFFEVLQQMLGDYGQKTKSELFTAGRGGSEPETLIARLMGTRFVVGAEIKAGVRLDEALVKDLCGGDIMTGRKLYQDHVNFKPTHKIWGYGNYRPTIHDTDKGIWRRIRLIPFEHHISGDQIDRELPAKLKAELPGILNWAIAGCLAWQQDGLGEAAAVTDATEDYRDEEDEIGEFIDDMCVLGGQETKSNLYAVFYEWCKVEHLIHPSRILSRKLFAMRMRSRSGIVSHKSNGIHWWGGISLKNVVKVE